MQLCSLALKNFRNQASLQLSFRSGTNLIVGNNGAGKTSILEAIQIASTTKSFKAKKELEIIKHNQPFASIKIEKKDNDELTTLQIQYQKSSESRVKKTYLLNDVPKASKKIIGELFTVLFTTDLINGFNETAGIRRKFFNQFLSQLDKEYLLYLGTYEKVLKNKAKALRMVKEGSDKKLLSYWNNELAFTGAHLVYKRHHFIKSLSQFLANHNIDKKDITLTYISRYPTELHIQEITEKIKEDISQHLFHEIESCRCLVGPHKDDYDVFFNMKNIKTFASRGEQKFSIALLLYAISQYIEEKRETAPIILLDDLSAEMDKTNMHAILSLFRKTNYQLILTAIDENLYRMQDEYVMYLEKEEFKKGS